MYRPWEETLVPWPCCTSYVEHQNLALYHSHHVSLHRSVLIDWTAWAVFPYKNTVGAQRWLEAYVFVKIMLICDPWARRCTWICFRHARGVFIQTDTRVPPMPRRSDVTDVFLFPFADQPYVCSRGWCEPPAICCVMFVILEFFDASPTRLGFHFWHNEQLKLAPPW